MSRFLTVLDAKVSKQMRGKRFERVVVLQKSFSYQSDILDDIVVVPIGFASDGASVPRALWSIYPPFDRYLEAAVVHDWFCVTKRIDSVTAAKVFCEAMAVCGVSWWRRAKMYHAVRWFGPKFEGV